MTLATYLFGVFLGTNFLKYFSKNFMTVLGEATSVTFYLTPRRVSSIGHDIRTIHIGYAESRLCLRTFQHLVQVSFDFRLLRVLDEG